MFGTRRKSYLVFFSMLQFVVMLALAMTESPSENYTAWSLFMANLCMAFCDVIVDSLLVIQARKYPQHGSEDLTAFSWTCAAAGGFFSAIIAAYMTQNQEPSYCFLISAMVGMTIAVIASGLDASFEEQGRREQSGSFLTDVSRNFAEIGDALRISEFHNMLAYIFVSGMLVPTFNSFEYFFLLDVVGISKFTFSMLTMLTFACFLVGTQLYNKYFKEQEYRHLVMMEAIISIFLAPLTLIFVLRLNLSWGIPDMAMLIFNDIVRDVVG